MVSLDGGVCRQTRWRHSVTVTDKDGGHVLLWQRYDNKMAAMRYQSTFAVKDVYTERVIDVFYIFHNSTIVDWTCLLYNATRRLLWQNNKTAVNSKDLCQSLHSIVQEDSIVESASSLIDTDSK